MGRLCEETQPRLTQRNGFVVGFDFDVTVAMVCVGLFFHGFDHGHRQNMVGEQREQQLHHKRCQRQNLRGHTSGFGGTQCLR